MVKLPVSRLASLRVPSVNVRFTVGCAMAITGKMNKSAQIRQANLILEALFICLIEHGLLMLTIDFSVIRWITEVRAVLK
jgi:hypothetical protein